MLVSVFAVDETELPIDLIVTDIDVGTDGTYLFFTGYNSSIVSGSDGFFGVVEITTQGKLGRFKIRETGTTNPISIDEQDGIVWITGQGHVQKWFYPSYYHLESASNITYFSADINTVFREVVARPFYDTVSYVCRYDGALSGYAFQGVVVFVENGSSLDDRFYVWGEDTDSHVCRGMDIDESAHLFVDNGQHGMTIYDIEANHNLTLDSDNDYRPYGMDVGNSYWGRSDVSNVFGDYLFTAVDYSTLGNNLAEFIMRIDISNVSNPVFSNSVCVLTGSATTSIVQSLEPFNESVVLLIDNADSSIYACEFIDNTTTYAVEIWDNPRSEESFKFESYFDGGRNWFFSHDVFGILRLFELITAYDDGGNYLPYFTTAPDEAFIDNLNPLKVGLEAIGIDSPVVVPYPLNCVNQFYDCTEDIEGDSILFAINPDYNGTDIAYDWHSWEGVSFTYEESGNHTMRIYITDDVHPDVYLIYRDFNIEVRDNVTLLGENESTLKFKVVDSSFDTPISAVYVDVSGGVGGYTNSNGLFVEVVDVGVYLVEFSKTNYVTKANYFSTSELYQEVLLTPTADPNRRTLIVVVKDVNGTVLSDVFVQIQMPNIVQFDFGYTDANGRVVFYPEEDNVVIVIDTEEQYEISSTEAYVPLGSTTERTVTLRVDDLALIEDVIDGGSFTVTGCQDYIRGVLLCDYDKVTTCTLDDQCLTGLCTNTGHCSNFNWNLCDDQEMKRGSVCFLKNVILGFMRGVGNWILDNFFYVLLIVLFLVGALILSLRKR